LQDDNTVCVENVFFPYLNANIVLSLLPNEAAWKKFRATLKNYTWTISVLWVRQTEIYTSKREENNSAEQ